MTGSFVAVKGEFQSFFSLDKASAKSFIQLWVKRFDEFAAVVDLNKAFDDRETHSG